MCPSASVGGCVCVCVCVCPSVSVGGCVRVCPLWARNAAEAQPLEVAAWLSARLCGLRRGGQATGVWRALGHCVGLGTGLGPELLAAACGSTKAIISLPRQPHFPRELLIHRRQQTPPRDALSGSAPGTEMHNYSLRAWSWPAAAPAPLHPDARASWGGERSG